MKKIIKSILIKVSRILLRIIPVELIPQKETLDTKIQKKLIDETLLHFEEHIKNSLVFHDVWRLRESAIKSSLSYDKKNEFHYLEFGVWKGESSNFFSKYLNKLYCFDSFEGLKEDWVDSGMPFGHFNLDKKVPKLNSNIEPIVG